MTTIKFSTNRLFICFDTEDPTVYAKRVANAFQLRRYAESLIRYNFIIDNMPTDELPGLEQEQVERILPNAYAGKYSDKSSLENNDLLYEVSLD